MDIQREYRTVLDDLGCARLRIGYSAPAVEQLLDAGQLLSMISRARRALTAEPLDYSTTHEARLLLARALHHGWDALVRAGGDWRPLTDDGTGDHEAIFSAIDVYDSTPIPWPLVGRALDFARWVLRELARVEGVSLTL